MIFSFSFCVMNGFVTLPGKFINFAKTYTFMSGLLKSKSKSTNSGK